MRPACHIAGLVAAIGLATACAPASGWKRTGQRVCADDDAPIVCLVRTPDGGEEVRVANSTLVAGECTRAPEGKRGGSVRVTVTAPDRSTSTRRLRAPRGQATIVDVDHEGRARVAARSSCDGLPFW